MMLRFLSSKWSWHLILLFVVFSITISTSGYLFHQNQKNRLMQEQWKHLAAIADFKVSQITAWRKERIADAEVIFKHRLTQQYFREILESPKSNPVEQDVRNWISSVEDYFQYQRVLLVNRMGSVVFAVPEGRETLDPVTMTLIPGVMTRKEMLLSDLYLEEKHRKICINLFVPILAQTGVDSAAEGILIICIDPNRALYPLIQAWPTLSQTAESLLIRAEGEEGVFLNKLRHREDTPLTLRFSLSNKKLPATMALSGQEGTVQGIDYRGSPVLAVLRHIPDSPWFLVSKVDLEEIYTPVQKQIMLTGIIVGLLVIGAGLTVGLLWRGQRLREGKRIQAILKETNEELEKRVAERSAELQARNEALRDSEERLRQLSSQILKVQEDERQRIAEDIHDSLIAQMSAIKLNMENVLNRTKGDSIASDSLRSLIDLTGRGIDETRRIMADLRPSMLDDLGLLPALNWYCREFGNRYPQIRIEKDFETTEEQIPKSLRTTVFRISQEAFNNAVKHGKANFIRVYLNCTDNQLDLTITDDGEGMDSLNAPGGIEPKESFGLASLRERARLSGGQFTVESTMGQGTTIRASWPIQMRGEV
jgi:signal transduction histidine kinase